METRKEDSSKILIITSCNNNENVKFIFSSGTSFTYSLSHLSSNSEYISTNIWRQQKRIVLDLTVLGWGELCPYLMVFIEFIGGSYEYPLNVPFGLNFLKFSEFFKLQGLMHELDKQVIKKLSLNEIHKNYKKLWSYQTIPLSAVEKVIAFAIQSAGNVLDIMRGYLDWIDEKSFRSTSEVLKSNAFMLIQQLIKMQKFYHHPFENKKEAIKLICEEYEIAFQAFNMQELMNNGWI